MSLLFKNCKKKEYFVKYIHGRKLFTVKKKKEFSIIFILGKIISVHEIIWKCCAEMSVFAIVETEPFFFI